MVSLSVYEQIQKRRAHDEPQSRIAAKPGISRATVRKYWKMSGEQFKQYQALRARRARRFNAHRDEIIELLELNGADAQQVYASSVYDVLEERHGSLPGTLRSLSGSVEMLRDSGAVEQGQSDTRIRRGPIIHMVEHFDERIDNWVGQEGQTILEIVLDDCSGYRYLRAD